MTMGEDGDLIGESSKQLPNDPFKYKHTGLLEPPYAMEQLVFLAEQHPTHAAALEQKAADIIGAGWEWEFTGDDDDEQKEDDSQKDKLEEWFDSLADDTDTDETTEEILLAAVNDLETVGHGVIELSRTTQGKLEHWHHMPAHTTRFHKDGIRVCQIRQNKKRWFKRWIPGDDRKVDMITGKLADEVDHEGNEVLVIKRPSRRSSYYGIPVYIPATGWITLSTAARDDNLHFFSNRREPRWVVVLENVDDDPQLENQLREALQVDLEKPHKNLLLPLSGPAKVHFQKLGDNTGDLSWEKLQNRADDVILISHRMPGQRIGITVQGALGGSVAIDTVRVYKEAVVQPGQRLLAARVNKLIRHEKGFERTKYKWRPKELDLTEEGADKAQALDGFTRGVLRLDEARDAYGVSELNKPDDEEGEVDPRADKFFFELAPQAAAAAQMMGMLGGQLGVAPQPGGEEGALQDANQRLASSIQNMLDEEDNGQPGTEAELEEE